MGISEQYLFDIERGNRNPKKESLIRRFANVLEIDFDYLMYLNGRIPEDLIRMELSEDEVKKLFNMMRKGD
jgi:transcriptional regulator with XRE-family HTH domain